MKTIFNEIFKKVLSDEEIERFALSYSKVRIIDAYDLFQILIENLFPNFYFLKRVYNTMVNLEEDKQISHELTLLLYDQITKYLQNLEESNDLLMGNSIIQKREYVQKVILAILSCFKNDICLGAKKRIKLLYFFKYQDHRELLIEARKKQLMADNYPIKPYDFIPGSFGIQMNFLAYPHGQYEKTIDFYVEDELIMTGYVIETTKGKGSPRILNLTERGKRKVQELKESDNQFQQYLKVAKQMAEFFDDMKNNEFEFFIKKIFPDWNIHGLGAYYDDFE